MNKKAFLAGFSSRFSIAYAVVIGAVTSTEILNYFNANTTRYVGLWGSVLLLGIFLGGLFLGRLADLRGRVQTILLSTIIRSIGMFLTLVSTNIYIALITRLIAGLGIGGAMSSTASYILERSRKEVRGRNVVLMESMRARGSFASGLIAYFSYNAGLSRKVSYGISALLGLITLVLVKYAPETYVRLAKINPKYQEKAAELGYKIVQEKITVRDVIRKFALITALIRVIRAIAGFTYYYRMYTVRKVLEALGASGASGIAKMTISLAAQLIGYAYAYLLIDKLGRKFVLYISFILGALSLPLYYLSPTIAGMAFMAFNVGVRGTIYSYTPELYPTDVRGTALGAAVAMARVGAFIGPIVGAWAIGISVSARIAVLAIVHAAGVLFVIKLPETKGKTIS